MPVTALAPQASASANSATFARGNARVVKGLGNVKGRLGPCPARGEGAHRRDREPLEHVRNVVGRHGTAGGRVGELRYRRSPRTCWACTTTSTCRYALRTIPSAPMTNV